MTAGMVITEGLDVRLLCHLGRNHHADIVAQADVAALSRSGRDKGRVDHRNQFLAGHRTSLALYHRPHRDRALLPIDPELRRDGGKLRLLDGDAAAGRWRSSDIAILTGFQTGE